MGLGKTLTALATIVGSLERAREFASRGNGQRRMKNDPVTISKATVIVVPSERKIVHVDDDASLDADNCSTFEYMGERNREVCL